MVEAGHDVNLHLHHRLLLLLLVRDDLHCELLPGRLLLAEENCSEAAAAELGQDCVVVGWVLIVLDRYLSVGKRSRKV